MEQYLAVFFHRLRFCVVLGKLSKSVFIGMSFGLFGVGFGFGFTGAVGRRLIRILFSSEMFLIIWFTALRKTAETSRLAV